MTALSEVSMHWLIGIALNTGLLALAWLLPKKLLTPWGYAHAWVLGILLWGSFGWPGLGVTLAYFALGVAVTKVGFAQKEAAGIAEGRGGVRGPGNVWGSALVAALCGLLLLLLKGVATPDLVMVWEPLLQLGMVASLATKLADTSATEIGKAYGQHTFLITTLAPVPRGTEGAVSLEGTLAGIGGSIVLAVIAWIIGLITAPYILLCIVAAFIATTIESLIGATLEDRVPGLTHDVVNIINTLIGAGVAIASALIYR